MRVSDTAIKGGPQNDWSVCTTWIVANQHRWFLIDVFRARLDYPALRAKVEGLASAFKAQKIVVEDAASGTMLVQELRSRISGIVAVRPKGDKASRMAVASAKFEAGQVFSFTFSNSSGMLEVGRNFPIMCYYSPAILLSIYVLSA